MASSSVHLGDEFRDVLLLNEDDVRQLLTMELALEALEQGLRRLALDEAQNAPRSRVQTDHAMLHVMSAAAKGIGQPASGTQEQGPGSYLAAKLYTTSRVTGARFLVPLLDGRTGQLLSLIQADYLGQVRTGAASGVATKYMARPDADDVGLFGTGKQARTQLEAVCKVRPIQQVHVYSRNEEHRRRFAEEMSVRCETEVIPASRPQQAAEGKDIIITATTSREPVLRGIWVAPGTHINAIGSNFLSKSELDVEVFRRCADVVVDSKDQSRIEAGDFQQALDEGSLHWSDVHELAPVIVGRYPVREKPDDVTLFKSLGVALEDLVVAAYLYVEARKKGVGRVLGW